MGWFPPWFADGCPLGDSFPLSSHGLPEGLCIPGVSVCPVSSFYRHWSDWIKAYPHSLILIGYLLKEVVTSLKALSPDLVTF